MYANRFFKFKRVHARRHCERGRYNVYDIELFDVFVEPTKTMRLEKNRIDLLHVRRQRKSGAIRLRIYTHARAEREIIGEILNDNKLTDGLIGNTRPFSDPPVNTATYIHIQLRNNATEVRNKSERRNAFRIRVEFLPGEPRLSIIPVDLRVTIIYINLFWLCGPPIL